MRKRLGLLLTLLLAGVLSVTPAASGSSPQTFTFYGSGYGHGLGLSQWGAYGLAQQGWTYKQILIHFYTGTTVGKASTVPSKLRIGLIQNQSVVHLTAQEGRVELQLQGTEAHVAWIPEGQTWSVRAAATGEYRIRDAVAALVGGQSWGSASGGLVAVPAPGAMVKVTETGHPYKRGTIEFNTYRPCDGCDYRERLIAVLGPQAYLYGIGEVSSSWPMQALETQAVAARTYAFEKVGRLGQHRPTCNCGLYASTLDQNYVGWDKESGYLGNRWVDAVVGTADQVVKYKGAPIQAYYHSSSGGFTENNENVWGGSPIPYLRGVCDPGDYSSANPVRTWTVTFTDAAITQKLAPYTGSIGTVTGFSGIVRGVSSRIESITIAGTTKKATISGAALEAALGMRDTRVWVGADRNVTGAIRDRYDALMCAPGAPTGPQSAVTGGRRQTFADGALYRNAAWDRVIWLHGSVYTRYLQLGEVDGTLGLPVSDIRTVKSPKGCRTHRCTTTRFEKGGMYFKDAAGVGLHELNGRLYRFFRSLGGVQSGLGFPTSDLRMGAGGVSSATFEGGKITCTKKGVCSVS